MITNADILQKKLKQKSGLHSIRLHVVMDTMMLKILQELLR